LAQIFPSSANRAPAILALGATVLGLAAALGVWWFFSPEFTDVGYMPRQPVPFSHALHAGELQLDCRYCHYTVERSPVAAVPATSICMNCHTIVGRDKETLAMVRDSAALDRPIEWLRVHNLPDFARFDHSLHLAAGVGCSSCHGDVRSMAEVRQVKPLSMGWCLECHRDPDPNLRPADELTNTTWTPPADQMEFAATLRETKTIAPPQACTGCHQ
jgi:Cytochrome c7 and related cytochrome c/Class III cytochrome C family